MSESLFARCETAISTIFPRFSSVKGLKKIISSSRFRNSGRKERRRIALTPSLASGVMSPPLIPSRIISEPRFEVIMIMVFLKSTVFP